VAVGNGGSSVTRAGEGGIREIFQSMEKSFYSSTMYQLPRPVSGSCGIQRWRPKSLHYHTRKARGEGLE
jgi:hypothetical protein